MLVSWYILNGSQDFFHTFSMAFYYKWDVKNDFAYVLQFISPISDSLGSVYIQCSGSSGSMSNWKKNMTLHAKTSINQNLIEPEVIESHKNLALFQSVPGTVFLTIV